MNRKSVVSNKSIFLLRTSLFVNLFLFFGKFILGLFYDYFFCISGIFNAFIFLSKRECLHGLLAPREKFEKRNRRISFFLFCAGVMYGVYMTRLLFFTKESIRYPMQISILIAFVAFLEFGFALGGILNDKGKGRFFRNLKIINFCSALTAIMLTQIVLLSFQEATNVNKINGIVGISLGFLLIILSVFIYFAPQLCIEDRSHQVFQKKGDEKSKDLTSVRILLKKNKIYGDYIYEGERKEKNIVDGYIVKEKAGFYSLPLFFKILLLILSEILIFPYLIGRLFYFFSCAKLPQKLMKYMEENQYEWIK